MPPDPSPIADPLSDSALTERIGYLFAKLHNRWSGESAASLREAGLGLSGLHFGALSVIESAGPMSQHALGGYLKKDRTSVVAIVDELEQEGLVERRRNPDDRRAYALQVTEEGRRWCARAKPLLLGIEDRMLAGLEASERETLVSLLQRVLFSDPPR